MVDVTIKRFDELESYHGQFLYASRGLGVTAWGMNVLKLPPNWPDHTTFLMPPGSVTGTVQPRPEMNTSRSPAQGLVTPGLFARVGPGQKRKIVPGPEGVTILALGGTPGKAYEPPTRSKSAK